MVADQPRDKHTTAGIQYTLHIHPLSPYFFLRAEVCIIFPHPFFSYSFFSFSPLFFFLLSFLPFLPFLPSFLPSSSSSPSSLLHLLPPPTHFQLPLQRSISTQLHTSLLSLVPSYPHLQTF